MTPWPTLALLLATAPAALAQSRTPGPPAPLAPDAFDARGFDRLSRHPPRPIPPGAVLVLPPALLAPPPPPKAAPPPPPGRPMFTDGWTRDGFGASR